jgi:3-phosphoshikimate 1-carboxyvinyltransferase
MLKAMGLELLIEGSRITVDGPQDRLSPLDTTIPGDFSSAAFLAVAATVIPHSKVAIAGVGCNRTRTGLMNILAEMGARIEVSNKLTVSGEPAATLHARFEELEQVQVRGDTVVRAIDEFPVWAVAATQASGTSILSDAAELRVKEVDRIAVLAAELRKMGAVISERPDGLVVEGPARLRGAEVDSRGDHRLGMALAIAGLSASEPTTVLDAGCIGDSYPDFVESMRDLGANMEWL